MRKVAAFVFLLLFLPVWGVAQIPPVGSLTVGTTSITNGTNGQCLYQNGSKLGEQACGAGTAANITVGTTAVTGAADGDILTRSGGNLGKLTPGTGIATALGVNVGVAGAPSLVNGVVSAPVLLANLPSPGTAGRLIRVSNFGTKGAWFEDNGTRWRPQNGYAGLYTLDTPSSGVNGSETIVAQYQLPISGWQIGDVIRAYFYITKTGTTNTGTVTFRYGSAGTVGGDAGIGFSSPVMSAAQHQFSGFVDFKLLSNTSVMVMVGNQSGYGSGTTNGVPAAVTGLPDVTANSNFIDVSITGGATDAVIMQNVRLEYLSSLQ